MPAIGIDYKWFLYFFKQMKLQTQISVGLGGIRSEE